MKREEIKNNIEDSYNTKISNKRKKAIEQLNFILNSAKTN